jgi:hypothetical protein
VINLNGYNMTPKEFEQLEILFSKLEYELHGRLCIVRSVSDGYELGLYDSNGKMICSSGGGPTIESCANKIISNLAPKP